MKTTQDWGFISKEQGLVKPKLQDNKIFHALTTAYENNQQNEIYGATENILRREKELCTMAISDLKKVSGGKSESDETLKLVLEHYQIRLEIAKEKEEKINHLSDDSRKMMEEYKKRTQELAEVKRNLMESQTKLREIAKTTERLIKKEEELRFIESHLRTELDHNKRDIINGLYEIVSDFSDHGSSHEAPQPIAQNPAPKEIIPEASIIPHPIIEPKKAPTIPATDQIESNVERIDLITPPKPKAEELVMKADEFVDSPSKLSPNTEIFSQPPRLFTDGLFHRNEKPDSEENQFHRDAGANAINVWTRNKISAASESQFAAGIAPPIAQEIPKQNAMIEKAARLKMFEPGKSLVSKSLVKTEGGESISEYFYSPLHPREGRHYIFNSLFAVGSLCSLKAQNQELFQERLETVCTDLLSRLEHGQNIHLESFLSEEINKEALKKIISAAKADRGVLFDQLATKLLNRIESIGPGRAGLIDNQFRQMPKPEYPPKPGLTA